MSFNKSPLTRPLVPAGGWCGATPPWLSGRGTTAAPRGSLLIQQTQASRSTTLFSIEPTQEGTSFKRLQSLTYRTYLSLVKSGGEDCGSPARSIVDSSSERDATDTHTHKEKHTNTHRSWWETIQITLGTSDVNGYQDALKNVIWYADIFGWISLIVLTLLTINILNMHIYCWNVYFQSISRTFGQHISTLTN